MRLAAAIKSVFRGLRKKAWFPADDWFFLSQRQQAQRTKATLTDPYSQIPWVRSAINRKLDMVSSVALQVLTGKKRGEDGKPLDSDDPLQTLLTRPNPWTSSGEFAGQIVAYLDLSGEYFGAMFAKDFNWWMRDSAEGPREILTLNPASVRAAAPDIDPSSGIIRRWTVSTASGDVKIPAESMLHIKTFNPLDIRRGSSPLSAVNGAMDAEVKADAYQGALLANDGVPGGVLNVPGSLGSEEAKALREGWEERHKGPEKAARIAILHGGATYQALAQTAKDMAMPALRDWNKDAIKAVLGVTDFEVGTIADYNRASSQTAKAWIWDATLIPTMHRIEDALWAQVFIFISAGRPDDVWAAFDTSKVEALKPNLTETSQQAATLIGAGYDPAAVSEKLGLGLDVAVVVDTTPADAVPPTPPVAKSAKALLSKDAARAGARRFVDRAERALLPKVRAAFSELHAETMARINGQKDAGTARPWTAEEIRRLLGDPKKWGAAMAARVATVWPSLNAAQRKTLEREIGPFKVIEIDKVFAAEAAKRTARMVKVASATQGRIAETLFARAKADEGWSVDKMAKEIDAKFGSVILSSGATIARTESAAFANDTRHAAFKAEGIDSHEWSASGDVHTRDSHDSVNGEVRKIGVSFSNGLMYPSEPGAAAEEVINCRCAALAVVSDI